MNDAPRSGIFAAAQGSPPSVRTVLLTSIGVACGIAAVGGLSSATGALFLLGSFGSSSVLLFGYPQHAFSRPRNVILGHFLCTLVGLVFVAIVGAGWLSMALAVGVATAAMMIARCVHPPAGANPIIVCLTLPGWRFLLFPTLAGALVLVAVGIAYHRLREARRI